MTTLQTHLRRTIKATLGLAIMAGLVAAILLTSGNAGADVDVPECGYHYINSSATWDVELRFKKKLHRQYVVMSPEAGLVLHQIDNPTFRLPHTADDAGEIFNFGGMILEDEQVVCAVSGRYHVMDR